jgi:hypothetical protein
MTAYERIEAARKARSGFDPFTGSPTVSRDPAKRSGFVRTDWSVCKVYDDGKRFELVRGGLTAEQAETMAGRKRDAMTDAQCAEALQAGWNYKARMLGGSSRQNVKVANRGPWFTKRNKVGL